MAEKTYNIEETKKRREHQDVTTKHLDAKHLKAFIESKILNSMTDIKSVESFCEMIKSYQKENSQEESIVFEILYLKAQKRLADMQGQRSLSLEYIVKFSSLEERYDKEEA